MAHGASHTEAQANRQAMKIAVAELHRPNLYHVHHGTESLPSPTRGHLRPNRVSVTSCNRPVINDLPSPA